MIGSSVYSVLKNDCDLILVYRNADKLNLLNQKYGGVETRTKYQLDLLPAYGEYVRGFAGELHCQTLQALITELKTCDFVINALGIIKPYCDSDPGLAFFVNSVFPQVLATELGPKLILPTACLAGLRAPLTTKPLPSSRPTSMALPRPLGSQRRPL